MSDYQSHYKKLDNIVFPSEWIVRAFLGRYENYKAPSRSNKSNNLDKTIYLNKTILDIGYGDGRNLCFFKELGMKVYGIEPLEEVIAHSSNNFKWAILKQGSNCNIPFKENMFDYVIASHSIYYLNNNQTLKESLEEARRVLKKNGSIFFTVPTSNNHTLKDALKHNISNQWILRDLFYNVRKGQLIETIDNQKDLLNLLENVGFNSINIAKWNVNWWGTLEDSFLVCAKK